MKAVLDLSQFKNRFKVGARGQSAEGVDWVKVDGRVALLIDGKPSTMRAGYADFMNEELFAQELEFAEANASKTLVIEGEIETSSNDDGVEFRRFLFARLASGVTDAEAEALKALQG